MQRVLLQKSLKNPVVFFLLVTGGTTGQVLNPLATRVSSLQFLGLTREKKYQDRSRLASKFSPEHYVQFTLVNDAVEGDSSRHLVVSLTKVIL